MGFDPDNEVCFKFNENKTKNTFSVSGCSAHTDQQEENRPVLWTDGHVT